MAKVREGYKETEIGVIPVEWEVKRLIELSDRSDRYSFTGGPFGSDLKSSDYTEDGVRVIQLQNIGDGKFYNISKVYTSYEKANQLSSCNIFPNEIILAKMAEPVARACKMPSFNDRYLMCSDGIRLKVDSNFYNTDYCLHSINSSYFRKKAIENSTGTTRLRIGLTALKELKLAIPTLQEQQRIAEILSTTDEHIEKLDKTIEDYQLLKKGMMKKLLTEGIGHTEFKETEVGRIPKEWEVDVLDNICVRKGLVRGPFGGSLKKEYFVEKGYKVYEQKNAISKSSKIGSYFINEDKYNELDRFSLKEGDFIVSCSGTIGKIYKMPQRFQKGIINQALLKITIDDSKLYHDFFYEYFEWDNFQKKIIDNTQGGAMKNLVGMDIIKKTVFPLPPLPEQQQIASILSEIDNKIDLYQQQRQDFTQLKKALMEQLLTGKIRVKQ